MVVTGNNSAGFTLVEVMITLAIAATLAIVAVPSFTNMMVNNSILAASSDLSTDIALARTEALRRFAAVQICSSNTGVGCTGTGGQVGWLIVAADGTIIKVHPALSDGVTITPPGGGSTTFSAAGYPAAATNWTICKTGFTGRVIDIAAGGRISTSPTPGACPPP